MHSKRRYKICICSVLLGELVSFRNYKGLSIIFPKKLRWNLTTKERHFLVPLAITFLNPKILGSVFLLVFSTWWKDWNFLGFRTNFSPEKVVPTRWKLLIEVFATSVYKQPTTYCTKTSTVTSRDIHAHPRAVISSFGSNRGHVTRN